MQKQLRQRPKKSLEDNISCSLQIISTDRIQRDREKTFIVDQALRLRK